MHHARGTSLSYIRRRQFFRKEANPKNIFFEACPCSPCVWTKTLPPLLERTVQIILSSFLAAQTCSGATSFSQAETLASASFLKSSSLDSRQSIKLCSSWIDNFSI